MQARNHENSDEFRAPPVRHLDLATRPFTITVRTITYTQLITDTHASQDKTHRDTTDHIWCFRKGRDSTDLRTCLLSASSWHVGIKGRDSTDQNIFVISELLMRIITHHTSYTYTHLNSTDPRTTSPGWLSASSWHVCEFVTCRYKGPWKHGPEHN